jgi:hypothetical protein
MTQTKRVEARIVAVLKVEDTREYEQGENDRWYPIPGSGRENECARCGRLHEVHAEVRLEDGTTTIVGTGCMGAESLEASVRRASGSAKTVARLTAELARARATLDGARAAQAEIATLASPAVTFTTEMRATQSEGEIVMLRAACGGEVASRWLRFVQDTPALRGELAELAEHTWRVAQYQARGFEWPVYIYEERVRDTEKRLARAQKKMAETLAGAAA